MAQDRAGIGMGLAAPVAWCRRTSSRLGASIQPVPPLASGTGTRLSRGQPERQTGSVTLEPSRGRVAAPGSPPAAGWFAACGVRRRGADGIACEWPWLVLLQVSERGASGTIAGGPSPVPAAGSETVIDFGAYRDLHFRMPGRCPPVDTVAQADRGRPAATPAMGRSGFLIRPPESALHLLSSMRQIRSETPQSSRNILRDHRNRPGP